MRSTLASTVEYWLTRQLDISSAAFEEQKSVNARRKERDWLPTGNGLGPRLHHSREAPPNQWRFRDPVAKPHWERTQ